MTFGHLEVKSCDVPASLAFWLDILGFQHEADQGEFQWVSKQGFEVLLRPGSQVTSNQGPEDGEVQPVLYTSDLESIRARLEASSCERAEGPDCLFVRDPGGLWIQIVNPESHQ